MRHAVRKDAELQRFDQYKLVQKGLGEAKVTEARKLGILLWMLLRVQAHARECLLENMILLSSDRIPE